MRNPKELKWSDLKTGIFFVLGIGFAAYLGMVIGKNTSVFSGVTTIKIMTRNVDGLAENNFVAVSGKKIGTVSSLNFTTRHDSLYVVADLKLRNEFASLVTRDSKASIRSLGVLGDKYVDITAGNGAPVKEGDFIRLEEEGGMAALASNATQTLEKINRLLDNLNSGKGPAGRLISDEKMGNELQSTMSNLHQTSAQLSKFSTELSSGKGLLPRLVNDKSLADNTVQTMQNLKQTSAEAETMLKSMNSSQSSFGRLNSDPALYNNLNRTMVSLDSLLIDLKKRPNRYVRFTLF
ncbi:MAG: MCE family protein [Chlorobiaceae bacterium]|nr:MlaD family protein [Chlorobiales bacterium]NTU90840.1 MCE family protein [Chlorobiaceae bacterium]NTV26006.1 MCE family protein [Chlorobiaceae bacterium]